MSLATIRSDILQALASASGLRVYDHAPGAVTELPAAIVTFSGANYADLTFTFSVLVLAGSWDAAGLETAVLPFIDVSGPSSIPALLNAQPGCVAVSAGRPGPRRIGGAEYRAVELTVTAMDAP